MMVVVLLLAGLLLVLMAAQQLYHATDIDILDMARTVCENKENLPFLRSVGQGAQHAYISRMVVTAVEARLDDECDYRKLRKREPWPDPAIERNVRAAFDRQRALALRHARTQTLWILLGLSAIACGELLAFLGLGWSTGVLFVPGAIALIVAIWMWNRTRGLGRSTAEAGDRIVEALASSRNKVGVWMFVKLDAAEPLDDDAP